MPFNPYGKKFDTRILLSPFLYNLSKLKNKISARELSLFSKTGQQVYSNTSNNIVIYLVHGFIDTDHCLKSLQNYLHEHFSSEQQFSNLNIIVRRVVFDGVFDPQHSTQDFAHKLLVQIFKNHDQNSTLIMVGHSLGGLKIAYLSEYLAGLYNLHIPINICISSPFNGSSLASIELPIGRDESTFRQMRANSTFAAELRLKIQASIQHKTRSYYFFAAEDDWVVKAKSSIVHPQHGYIVANCSHAGILETESLKSVIYSIVAEYLYSKQFALERKYL